MAARKLRISLPGGKTIDVQPTLEDRLNFETTLRRNRGWGDLKDNALKLEPFLAWSAAKRTGELDLSWDEFTSGETAALDVEAVKDDDEAPAGDDLTVNETVGKGTRRGRSTNSPSPSA
ncbi:hypothetical protein SAMN04515691_2984 [Leifsonia sp. 98AMF]|uniref:hypothetical protein n=1 Tax=unclassified Leifsonia TaxID=2663824 RepID=UPI00087B2342|nr:MULTISPECIES: hypothetical protein [unclassified Leifsonia]SDH16187.1 hypothetical protein SAMN04515690_1032 [Leifsonia sp. 197AMF]SDJ22095.1 hypothetical protein SAMN04515684_2750 [Leifsonia sp. 466MF]SDK61664.1 hypothetical protein SAMN04515683_4014 [Leifsonia sp. 157MF]SDN43776.1 hypothetical protein SAMN04515686_0934 [Leifsonia sp. 509MF]SEN67330.1 hypothetical protein SAMN04515685_3995 [Leifsonia sp. 467MF]